MTDQERAALVAMCDAMTIAVNGLKDLSQKISEIMDEVKAKTGEAKAAIDK